MKTVGLNFKLVEPREILKTKFKFLVSHQLQAVDMARKIKWVTLL